MGHMESPANLSHCHALLEPSNGHSPFCNGIRLRFEGKAYVHWTERHSTGSGKNRRTTTRHYSATEQYFNQDVLMFGIWPGQGSDTTKLPAGRHTFPFCFVLPPNLPSSFEGAHGYVRYSVKGIIDKPWKFDHTTKRPFTIIGILDLNADANAQITTFHATSKSRTVTKEIGRMTERPIEEGKSFSWEGQQFVLPPLPPSYLVGCRIIDVRYVLQLNVDPSGPAVDLEVPLEIIIGTIPLRRVVEQFPPRAPPAMSPPQAGYSMGPGYPMGTMHPSPEGATAPPMEPAMPYAPPTNIPNLPPPSYSESVFGKVNVKDEDDSDHTRGNLDYAPVYPYYDWGHQPNIEVTCGTVTTMGDEKY
ncbi:hypothetical protein BaRGS_00035180 [Batillaria attramentaria]|uniref:Arrestin C-terminal-like domain-containing protein n=1 Tax=Batillaria attramentaria TaxID=370345 RepID=A0ABD0JFD6_9CAEN